MNSFSKIVFTDLQKIHYLQALDYQKTKFEIAIQQKINKEILTQELIFCEHYPVYTIGKSGDLKNLYLNQEELKKQNIDFFMTNRGGDITFHGFGQLTIYPIFDLEALNIGLRKYIYLLEEVIIKYLENKHQIKAERNEKAAGVWIGNDKIAAVGVKSSRMITMHGIAFNINTDLKYFENINPCGLDGKGVCSLQTLTQKTWDLPLVKAEILKYFSEVFEIDFK
jgi:lipoyl(octanoyl) transferase